MSDPTESPDGVDPADRETELDRLAAAVRVEATRETLEPLWRGTMNLDRWYFPAVGDFPNLSPFAGMIDGEGYVMAFTQRERAERYAASQGLVAESERPRILAFPPVQAAKLCVQQHDRGANWVVFDRGWAGWRFLLADLAGIMTRYRDSD